MILISDECGCYGASYVHGSSHSYIASMVCFATPESLDDFVDTSKQISRKYLSTRLRKWTQLPAKIKNDPVKLENFVDDLFLTLRNNKRFFVFSFFLLNKKEIETGHRFADIRLIKFFSKDGYSYCLKRIFPFIRKMNYILGYYRVGTLLSNEWYIDTNNKTFQEELQNSITTVNGRHISLVGPIYVAKNDISRRTILNSIKIIDIIGGIASRAFGYYVTNCVACTSTDCFEFPSCGNPYIKVWHKLVSYTSNVEIVHEEKIIWNWYGIIYAPAAKRNIHSRFLGGDDKFFNY